LNRSCRQRWGLRVHHHRRQRRRGPGPPDLHPDLDQTPAITPSATPPSRPSGHDAISVIATGYPAPKLTASGLPYGVKLTTNQGRPNLGYNQGDSGRQLPGHDHRIEQGGNNEPNLRPGRGPLTAPRSVPGTLLRRKGICGSCGVGWIQQALRSGSQTDPLLSRVRGPAPWLAFGDATDPARWCSRATHGDGQFPGQALPTGRAPRLRESGVARSTGVPRAVRKADFMENFLVHWATWPSSLQPSCRRWASRSAPRSPSATAGPWPAARSPRRATTI